jgi:hypothetical protein
MTLVVRKCYRDFQQFFLSFFEKSINIHIIRERRNLGRLRNFIFYF